MEARTVFKRVKIVSIKIEHVVYRVFHIYLCHYASYPRHLVFR